MVTKIACAVMPFLLLAGCASEPLEVDVHRVSANGIGEDLGEIAITQSKEGAVFNISLSGLTPGEHGFHVHENPSCAVAEKNGEPVAALAAGGHYDPKKTGKHEGPYGKGHLGDLPKLIADEKGNVNMMVIAPRLKLKDLKGRTLMIHAGGDNYSDNPPMGGGGGRIACGVVY